LREILADVARGMFLLLVFGYGLWFWGWVLGNRDRGAGYAVEAFGLGEALSGQLPPERGAKLKRAGTATMGASAAAILLCALIYAVY
jgi:hypothetical protein